MERRYTDSSMGGALAVRGTSTSGKKVGGYASVFYANSPETEYLLFQNVKERIHRSAFELAIRERHDTRALLNHNPDHVLGRTASGTLRLSTDSKGLRYEIDMPASRGDVLESIRRGDISASSFGFKILDESWSREGAFEIRLVRSVQLVDISVVAFPAYSGATIDLPAARSAFSKREAVNRRFRFLQIQQQQG